MFSEMIIELDKPWPVDLDLPDGACLMNADRTYIAITSETGVTQGDALAMVLFTICLQRVNECWTLWMLPFRL